jgi:type I restriction enzyme S subunit
MSEGDLLEGWEILAFGDLLVDSQNGCSARAGTGTPTVVLRLADVSIDGTISSKGLRKIPLDAESRSKYSLAVGDLLAFRVNGSPGIAGRVVCYPGPAAHAYCDHFIRFRVDQILVLPRFVALGFQVPSIRHQVEAAMVSSAGQNTVSQASYREIELPIPPLAEQRRIVEKVEALLVQVNAARARLAKVPTILKRFRQSILSAACSGRLTDDWRPQDANHTDDGLPDGWQTVSVEALIEEGGIFDGPFGSNLKTSDYTQAGVRVIRMENIDQVRFIESKRTFISEEKYRTLVRHTVGEGDIIVASFVDDAVRACSLPKISTKAIAKADCFCVRVDHKVADPRFVAMQIVSRESYDFFREDIHGATRPRISTKKLRQLPVPLAPLPEQQEIVRRVGALFKLADAIEAHLAAATARADKLTQAVLAKAFRGELVPAEAELARQEGRDYEPASALLARIRASRTTSEAAAKPTTRARRANARATPTAKPARRKTSR